MTFDIVKILKGKTTSRVCETYLSVNVFNPLTHTSKFGSETETYFPLGECKYIYQSDADSPSHRILGKRPIYVTLFLADYSESDFLNEKSRPNTCMVKTYGREGEIVSFAIYLPSKDFFAIVSFMQMSDQIKFSIDWEDDVASAFETQLTNAPSDYQSSPLDKVRITLFPMVKAET